MNEVKREREREKKKRRTQHESETDCNGSKPLALAKCSVRVHEHDTRFLASCLPYFQQSATNFVSHFTASRVKADSVNICAKR